MIKQIIKSLEKEKFLLIPSTDLKTLLRELNIIEEINTHMCDFIRILTADDKILIQESTHKGEIIIRQMDSMEHAHKLIADQIGCL